MPNETIPKKGQDTHVSHASRTVRALTTTEPDASETKRETRDSDIQELEGKKLS